jgi:DNA-binding CsgD family transcriptional regulator
VVRGSSAGWGRVAVLLEEARPAELAAAIADVYALTQRERAITTLVARGLTTTEIAGRLRISAYTVQDHLKAIFAKSGTSSRGELVSRLFLDHHVGGLGGGSSTVRRPESVAGSPPGVGATGRPGRGRGPVGGRG